MTTNADITVFNKRYDPEDRTDYFVPTIIRGVYLYYKKQSTISKGTQTKSLNAVIRIPTTADQSGKEYVQDILYRDMESVDNAWTIQLGDFVIPKVISTLEPVTDSELARDYKDIITVHEFTDNTTIGSQAMRHWRIGGV